jgi:DNA-directed RNA polymerase specialized sigma24 family protein
MDNRDFLVEQFEEHRTYLRAVAYRMLGSVSEADDAVQEAWLRASRANASDVEDMYAWLSTIVSVSLITLRSRSSKRDEPLVVHVPEPIVSSEDSQWRAELGGDGASPSRTARSSRSTALRTPRGSPARSRLSARSLSGARVK